MINDLSDPHRFPTNSEVERRLLADPDFSWDGHCGGTHPVTVEFLVDGLHGAFRARGEHWSFVIAVAGVIDPASDADELFKIQSYFGEGAGIMPAIKALEYVETSIATFRQVRARTI